jgi:hypothetical protein
MSETTVQPETIRNLLEQLLATPLRPLSDPQAPEQPGIYVIYDAHGVCDYVGHAGAFAPVRGDGSLRARLLDQFRGNPSVFVSRSYGGDPSKVSHHLVRWLVIEDKAQRNLLKRLAIKTLCPLHPREKTRRN